MHDTWQKRRNLIDHVLIKKKRLKIIHDVKLCQEANADSDHLLGVTKLKMKITKKYQRRMKKKMGSNKTETEVQRNSLRDINIMW